MDDRSSEQTTSRHWADSHVGLRGTSVLLKKLSSRFFLISIKKNLTRAGSASSGGAVLRRARDLPI